MVPYPKPRSKEKFLAQVEVQGQVFESFALCSSKRQAKQIAARLALETVYPQFRQTCSRPDRKKMKVQTLEAAHLKEDKELMKNDILWKVNSNS
jgi:hypothetical protein